MNNFIVKNIPNTITCCNLISGCIAINFAFIGCTKIALLFIIIGALFDFFDGMSARLLKVSSPIGKELDSLADVITFGLAPSTLLFYELKVMEYPHMIESWRGFLPFVAFVMAAFSALRLAKFNLDERQTTSFIGLPMFALKFKHWGWKDNEVKYIFVISCVPLLIIFGISSFAIIIAWYVLLSVYVNTNKRK